MPEPCLSAEDETDYLGVTEGTMHDWLPATRMPAQKAGRRWGLQECEIEKCARSGGAGTREN